MAGNLNSVTRLKVVSFDATNKSDAASHDKTCDASNDATQKTDVDRAKDVMSRDDSLKRAQKASPVVKTHDVPNGTTAKTSIVSNDTMKKSDTERAEATAANPNHSTDLPNGTTVKSDADRATSVMSREDSGKASAVAKGEREIVPNGTTSKSDKERAKEAGIGLSENQQTKKTRWRAEAPTGWPMQEEPIGAPA